MTDPHQVHLRVLADGGDERGSSFTLPATWLRAVDRPEWPFLYAGTEVTRRSKRALLKRLEEGSA